MTCHHSGPCTDQVAHDLVTTHADYARGGAVGHTGVLFDLPYEDLSAVWQRFTDLDPEARNDVTGQPDARPPDRAVPAGRRAQRRHRAGDRRGPGRQSRP